MLEPRYPIYALRISHLTSLILTSSPAFSSYSYHSLSEISIPVNLVPDSMPVACQSPYTDISTSYDCTTSHRGLTSALNSTNSKPLQSNSTMFCFLGGLECGYGFGASLMLAECSLFVTSVKSCPIKKTLSIVTILDDKTGF